MTARRGLKDDVLSDLARVYNVAQFVSFTKGEAAVRHHVVRGLSEFHGGVDDVLAVLLNASPSGSVNIRSFTAERPAGNPFHQGITSVPDAAALIRKLARDGLYTIANETLPTDDGGVSGVVAGGIVEFAPCDTPRAVEKPGIARLPIEIGFGILGRIYGFPIDFGELLSKRIEFSVHPLRCGVRREHTTVWEESEYVAGRLTSDINWPNNFSRFLGDKAYGLLIADALGHPVPRTTVVARNVAPFSFGRPTGTGEWWLRTAPKQPVAGKYTTVFGWSDPFALLDREDTEGVVAAVLSQEGVDAGYSGATKPSEYPKPDLVQGVQGRGDRFMLGEQPSAALPSRVTDDVLEVTADLRKQLGDIRIEWAHDGTRVWVLQMHRVITRERFSTLGDAAAASVAGWLEFDTAEGLEVLRERLHTAAEKSFGINVFGDFGLTSHVGELLTSASIPVRIHQPAPAATG